MTECGWLISGRLQVPLHKNRVVAIGRAEVDLADTRVQRVTIDDLHISATHCYVWVIQFDSNTSPICYLKDVSRNGTFVNGTEVGAGNYTILRNSDIINLYHVAEFRYRAAENTRTSEAAINLKGWNILPDVIGVGTFGKVQIACHNDEPRSYYAVKTIQVGWDSDKRMIEHNILSKLDHVNVIQIRESITNESKGTMMMFQQLAIGGDMFSYLSQDHDYLQAIPESEAVFALYQICSGLVYLHKRGIVHRDLKLDNILVTDVPIRYPRLVLGDFGIAKECPGILIADSQVSQGRPIAEGRFLMQTLVGTAEYAAPEIGIGQEPKTREKKQGYSEKVDSWAVGVIAHILFSGVSPFYASGGDIHDMQMLAKNGLKSHALEGHRWKGISVSAKDFVAAALRIDPHQRPGVDSLLREPLFGASSRRRLLLQQGIEQLASGRR